MFYSIFNALKFDFEINGKIIYSCSLLRYYKTKFLKTIFCLKSFKFAIYTRTHKNNQDVEFMNASVSYISININCYIFYKHYTASMTVLTSCGGLFKFLISVISPFVIFCIALFAFSSFKSFSFRSSWIFTFAPALSSKTTFCAL